MSALGFETDEILPPNLRIGQSENHLYRIGLCLTCERPADRNAFHKPWLVFGVNLTFLLKTLYCICLDEEDQALLYLGDFSHLIGIRLHFNLACLFYTGFAVSLQVTQVYNYLRHIKPNYMSVFDMMSGLRTPKSMGITNQREILAITRTTRKIFLIARFATQTSVPIFQFTLSLTLFCLLCPSNYTVYGIVGSLHYTWASYYVYNIHVFGVIYFYIICRFIEIKINSENRKIQGLRLMKFCQSKSLLRAIESLASIHREISAYNENFWSMFLLFVWLMYGIVIVLCIFILFFSPMNAFIKIGYSYMTAIIVITFLFVMVNAASVNLKTRKSYRYLNSLVSTDIASHRLFHKSQVNACLKVNIKVNVETNPL